MGHRASDKAPPGSERPRAVVPNTKKNHCISQGASVTAVALDWSCLFPICGGYTLGQYRTQHLCGGHEPAQSAVSVAGSSCWSSFNCFLWRVPCAYPGARPRRGNTWRGVVLLIWAKSFKARKTPAVVSHIPFTWHRAKALRHARKTT